MEDHKNNDGIRPPEHAIVHVTEISEINQGTVPNENHIVHAPIPFTGRNYHEIEELLKIEITGIVMESQKAGPSKARHKKCSPIAAKNEQENQQNPEWLRTENKGIIESQKAGPSKAHKKCTGLTLKQKYNICQQYKCERAGAVAVTYKNPHQEMFDAVVAKQNCKTKDEKKTIFKPTSPLCALKCRPNPKPQPKKEEKRHKNKKKVDADCRKPIEKICVHETQTSDCNIKTGTTDNGKETISDLGNQSPTDEKTDNEGGEDTDNKDGEDTDNKDGEDTDDYEDEEDGDNYEEEETADTENEADPEEEIEELDSKKTLSQILWPKFKDFLTSDIIPVPNVNDEEKKETDETVEDLSKDKPRLQVPPPDTPKIDPAKKQGESLTPSRLLKKKEAPSATSSKLNSKSKERTIPAKTVTAVKECILPSKLQQKYDTCREYYCAKAALVAVAYKNPHQTMFADLAVKHEKEAAENNANTEKNTTKRSEKCKKIHKPTAPLCSIKCRPKYLGLLDKTKSEVDAESKKTNLKTSKKDGEIKASGHSVQAQQPPKSAIQRTKAELQFDIKESTNSVVKTILAPKLIQSNSRSFISSHPSSKPSKTKAQKSIESRILPERNKNDFLK